MRSSRHVALILTLLTFLTIRPLRNAAGGPPIDRSQALAEQLEFALNAKTTSALEAILNTQGKKATIDRVQLLTANFPDARWSIRPGHQLHDGLLTVDITICGQQGDADPRFTLEAHQRLALRVNEGGVTVQEIISERSILRSGSATLPVTLLIPDTVLIGSYYDIDIIFDEPLGNAIVAGGLVKLTPDQILNQQSPNIILKPLSSGGLFKRIRAPLQSGVQFWAALLVHPQGILAVTKRVRIVVSQDQIIL